jgi:hypothetical protein
MADLGHSGKGLGFEPIMIVRFENSAEVTHGVTGCFNDIYNSVLASASQTLKVNSTQRRGHSNRYTTTEGALCCYIAPPALRCKSSPNV